MRPQENAVPAGPPGDIDRSTLQEALHALDIGIQWLELQQSEEGYWSLKEFPALTALAVAAICRDPRRSAEMPLPQSAQRGIHYLQQCVQPDGGIYVPAAQGGGLPVYNTALSLMALVLADPVHYAAEAGRATDFLASSQHIGPDVYSGGFGYDAAAQREYADLSSTYMAIEAVWLAERSQVTDSSQPARTLNWDAAMQFLSRVQNLPDYNDQPWAQSPSTDDLGGFVYHPNESKAGDDKSADGSFRLHSYGSMSYAGLLSFLYADVARDDPRVAAAVDWIKRHFTLTENPGMGEQGLYYNYHTMAKALSYWGEEPLLLDDGSKQDWRKGLVQRIVTLQRIEADGRLGYWVNDNGRWWENNPVLATAYSLMALDVCLAGSVSK